MPVEFKDLTDIIIEDDVTVIHTFECKYPLCTVKHKLTIVREYKDYYLARYDDRNYDEVVRKEYCF